MNKLPLAKASDIVVQTLGKEVLIYDLSTHKAFNLNETSSIVYQACDGKTTLDELRAKTNFSDEIIFLAIDELNKENLLEKNTDYSSPFGGLSRREAIRKVGLASLIALPVIASLVAPTAGMAQSAGGCGTVGQGCTGANSVGSCCSGSAYCNSSNTCAACTASGNNIGTCTFGGTCILNQYVCCSGSATFTLGGGGCSAASGTGLCTCNFGSS